MEEPYILNKNIAGTMTVDDEDMAAYFARLKRIREIFRGALLYQYYRFIHPEEEEMFFPIHKNSIIKVEWY